MKAVLVAALFACCSVITPAIAEAVIDVPVILPLTGNAAFLGQGERESLLIHQAAVNRRGGINGATLRYSFHDDQSSPQVAVQLASQIAATRPPVVLGSAIVAMCNAMAPVLANGPVMYCFSPGIHPAPGSSVFTAFISTHDEAAALVRYYRERGFTKLAMITSSDASGQDGAHGFEDAVKLPENKGVRIVSSTRFNPSDVSVAAQIEAVKASGAEALIVWTSGAPFGTVLKAIAQGGLAIPVGTTDANMTYAQMAQYAPFLPNEALFMSSEWPEHSDGITLDPAVEAAQTAMRADYVAAGAKPDIAVAHAWDPGSLVEAAYRKFGPQLTATQMRGFLAETKGWAGVNGIYDFEKMPQRGLDVSNAVVARWMPATKTWTVVSRPVGGRPSDRGEAQ